MYKMKQQYHHYIPQFILKNFAVDDYHKKSSQRSIIKQYDLKLHQTTEVLIKRAYGCFNMYKDVNNTVDLMFVERKLADLESKASLVINKIKRTNPNEEFSILRSELYIIKKFLFIMCYRKPYRRNQYLNENFDKLTIDDITKYKNMKGFNNYSDIWLDNIKQILTLPKEEILKFNNGIPKTRSDDKLYHVVHSDYVANIMYFMCVWYAEEGTEFILTDSNFGLYEGYYPFVIYHTFYVITPKIAIVFCNTCLRKDFPVNPIYVSLNLPSSWFSDDIHLSPKVRYWDGNKYCKQPLKKEDIGDDDEFTYRLKVVPAKAVHLVNLIAINECDEFITYKTEQCMLKSIRFYELDNRSKNNYSYFKNELVRYINRTHS